MADFYFLTFGTNGSITCTFDWLPWWWLKFSSTGHKSKVYIPAFHWVKLLHRQTDRWNVYLFICLFVYYCHSCFLLAENFSFFASYWLKVQRWARAKKKAPCTMKIINKYLLKGLKLGAKVPKCPALVYFLQSWARSVFFNFFTKKMIFCIFYQVNLTGSGLFKKDWCRNRLLTFCYYREKTLWRKHFFLTDFCIFISNLVDFFSKFYFFYSPWGEKIFSPHLALVNIFLCECMQNTYCYPC